MGQEDGVRAGSAERDCDPTTLHFQPPEWGLLFRRLFAMAPAALQNTGLPSVLS